MEASQDDRIVAVICSYIQSQLAMLWPMISELPISKAFIKSHFKFRLLDLLYPIVDKGYLLSTCTTSPDSEEEKNKVGNYPL